MKHYEIGDERDAGSLPALAGVESARVTVLSPYHNRETAVEVTIHSLLAQTMTAIKAVIWDDCSSDGTWKEIQRVAAQVGDPRLSIYQHNPNIGLTAGLNHAIAGSDTEYIAICGSGDFCSPDRIARQVAELDAHPNASFCATASESIDIVSGRRFVDNSFDRGDIQLDDIREVSRFTHGSVMFRRSHLIVAGGYEPTFEWCADWDLFFRLLENHEGRYLDANLYTRYARLDGVSFHPVKSVSQVRHQGLAKLLAKRREERESILAKVREAGLAATLEAYGVDVSAPAYRRQIKLILMGRGREASEMAAVLKENGIKSTKYAMMASIARVAARMPVSTDRLIAGARSLKNLVR